ncbi:hypothetical protein [Granulicella sp. L46]|uniref:hypothetical protein n=1 Tax=Granulicella sp. L46 TaxID=1641865 RepID=UPI00131C8D04|nr:hypothetical protein [Granulicella sp. L46]
MADLAVAPSRVSMHKPSRTADRVFFSAMPFVMMAMVLYGFARTYFLVGMVAAPLPNKLIHVHGAVFTSWMILLIVQTALVATKKVKLHMTLGLFGFGLAVAMVVLGTTAAVDALRRGQGPLGLDAQTFFVIPISGMLLFGTLVFFAYKLRRNTEAHKRLILLATMSLMDAAVGRWQHPAILQRIPPTQDLVILALLLMLVGFDLFNLHRVSKYTWRGALFVIVVHLVRVPLGHTTAWHAMTARLL